MSHYSAKILFILVFLLPFQAIAHEATESSAYIDKIYYQNLDKDWANQSNSFASSRGSIWAAVGLLARNSEGDIDKATQAIEASLAQQLDAPGKYFHGTFLKRINSEEYISKLNLFNKLDYELYDYNFREFIGSSLILIKQKYSHLLSEDLLKKIDHAIYLAAEGAYLRNIPAEYTNIAIMQTYLLQYAGKQFNINRWLSRGKSLENLLYNHYLENHTFDEYNSPTYDGTTLIALAQWKDLSLSKAMHKHAEVMYEGLWESIVKHYNSNLKNISGPWYRSYGSNMQDYVSITGVLLADALPIDKMPLPNLEAKIVDHIHDLGTVSLARTLDIHLPASLQYKLLNQQSPQYFSEIIKPAPLTVATVFNSTDFMVGTLSTNGKMVHHQSKPLTIHWATGKEATGVVTLSSAHIMNGNVSRHGVIELEILDVRKMQPEDDTNIVFHIQLPPEEIKHSKITADQWQLAGKTFNIASEATLIHTIKDDVNGTLDIVYQFEPGYTHFVIK